MKRRVSTGIVLTMILSLFAVSAQAENQTSSSSSNSKNSQEIIFSQPSESPKPGENAEAQNAGNAGGSGQSVASAQPGASPSASASAGQADSSGSSQTHPSPGASPAASPSRTVCTMTVDIALDISADEMTLVSNSTNQEDIYNNSVHLQNLVNAVSAAGGGTITVPEGDFYMAPTYQRWTDDSVQDNEKGYIVICCKDQVAIRGAGQDKTTFFPYNETTYPTDMFGYVDIGSWDTPKYLVNCDFAEFTVDGSYAAATVYNCKGKGFYMAPVQDCDWDHVTVRFTDGTGFGMDEPINCTITNCIAFGCGKGADIQLLRSRAESGASGFGIGFGYSEQESILIENCKAIGNFHYGFFTENQVRFGVKKSDGTDVFSAQSFNGFIFRHCVAGGNTYNYGGELASYTIYEDCDTVADNDQLNALQVKSFKNYNFAYSDNILIIKQGQDVTQELED